MSRQQSRPSGDGAIDPSLVQKKRARHRLVGAICLCLIAAVVVPLVLESEPRPRDRDLPIELAAPDRHADAQPSGTTGSHAPAPPAADPAAAQSAVKTVVPPAVGQDPVVGSTRHEPRPPGTGDPARPEAGKTEAGKGAAAKTEVTRAEATKAEAAKQQAAKQEAARQEAAKQESARQEAAKASAKSDPSKPPAAQDKPGARSDEPDVLARLIDRTPAGAAGATGGAAGATGGAAGATAGANGAAAASRKFLVQIGAYSNVQSARTMSDRVVQVGLRPYQETVKTAQGDWIRVRVGPFTTRQDAERAQQDLKRAGVTAAIIAL